MSKLLRGLAAGYGARALGRRGGCGCLGTIVLFVILWWFLGRFGIFR